MQSSSASLALSSLEVSSAAAAFWLYDISPGGLPPLVAFLGISILGLRRGRDKMALPDMAVTDMSANDTHNTH